MFLRDYRLGATRCLCSCEWLQFRNGQFRPREEKPGKVSVPVMLLSDPGSSLQLPPTNPAGSDPGAFLCSLSCPNYSPTHYSSFSPHLAVHSPLLSHELSHTAQLAGPGDTNLGAIPFSVARLQWQCSSLLPQAKGGLITEERNALRQFPKCY